MNTAYCPSTVKLWIRALSLVVAVLFTGQQVLLAAPSAFDSLRPLAVEERDNAGPDGTSRREFLKHSIATAAAIAGAGLTASGVTAVNAPAAEITSDSSQIHQDILIQQRIILANSGLPIWPGAWASFRQRGGGSTDSLFEQEAARIESEEGLKFTQAQEKMLLALGTYSGAQGDAARSKALQGLLDTIVSDSPGSWFSAATAYWQAKAALAKRIAKSAEKRWQEDKENKPMIPTPRRKVDDAIDAQVIADSSLNEICAMRQIYKDLILIGCPLPSFQITLSPFFNSTLSANLGIAPVRDNPISVWDALPPVVGARRAPIRDTAQALKRIADNLKTIMRSKIRSLETQNRTRDRELAIQKILEISKLDISALEKETASYNEINNTQIQLLRSQIEAIDKMITADGDFTITDSSQLAASVVQWNRRIEQTFTNLDVIKSLMRWTAEEQKTYSIMEFYMIELKHKKFNEEVNLDICKILSECSQVIRELGDNFRDMGFAVPLPGALEQVNGFLGFQRFVTPAPVPLEKPLTVQEIDKCTADIKRLQLRYLELRALLKEKLASERTRQAGVEKRLADGENELAETQKKESEKKAKAEMAWLERRFREKIEEAAGNEELIKRIETRKQQDEKAVREEEIKIKQDAESWIIGNRVKKENADDELRLAHIETLEAKVLKAEIALLGSPEGTPQHKNAEQYYDGTVMELLKAKLSRIMARIPQIEKRARTSMYGEYFKALLQELICVRNQLRAQIKWYEDLKALGVPLCSPDFTPSGMVTVQGLAKLVKEGSQQAELLGYIKEIGADGKEIQKGVMKAGMLSLGRGTVLDNCNGTFGENTIYQRVPGGWSPCSQYVKVHLQRGLASAGLKDIMGETYIEIGAPLLGRQTAAGEYWVAGFERFYTISDRPIPLGIDPKSPKDKQGKIIEEKKTYLVAYTLYEMKPQKITLRDGRTITRDEPSPAKVIICSTKDRFERECDLEDPNNKIYNIGEGYPPVIIDTPTRRFELRITQRDPERPEISPQVERVEVKKDNTSAAPVEPGKVKEAAALSASCVLRPLAAAESTIREIHFPAPVWIKEHGFQTDRTQSSYLNRHLAEQEYIESILPMLVQKNQDTRTITLGLLGTSTGEEIARNWYCVATWLEKNGYPIRGDQNTRWQIRIRAVDVDPRVIEEAKARFSGESAFVYAIYNSDRNKDPDLEGNIKEFAGKIVGRVQQDKDLIKEAVKWIQGSMSNPDVLARLIGDGINEKEPDIIISNIASEYLPPDERTKLWGALSKMNACIITMDPFIRNVDNATEAIRLSKLSKLELPDVAMTTYYVRRPFLASRQSLPVEIPQKISPLLQMSV